MSDRDYARGQKEASLELLRLCLGRLGDRDRKAHSWRLERQRVVDALREICARHGDNDWADEDALDSVILNHLGAHLE